MNEEEACFRCVLFADAQNLKLNRVLEGRVMATTFGVAQQIVWLAVFQKSGFEMGAH